VIYEANNIINYPSGPEKSTPFPTLRLPFDGKKRGCFATSTNEMIQSYPEARIIAALEYAKEKKPENLPGFVFKALSEEWSLPASSSGSESKDPYNSISKSKVNQ